MPAVVWVAAGGAIGSALRYGVNLWSGRVFGTEFPWGTFIVNVAGCLCMGLLIGAMALRVSVSNEVRAFLTTGVLGGFTTFSAFSLDFAALVERKAYAPAMLYGTASVGLSIVAVFAGLAIARSLAS
jgi:fluoride exporter